MELEDIIYIIATIIIFVISLLGKKKKKRPDVSNNEEVEYTLNDFEKILERKQIVSEPEKENIEESYVDEPIEEENLDHIPENYHFTEDENVEEENVKIVNKKKNEEIEEENEDGFDLKSAIVYSSILERKKYRH